MDRRTFGATLLVLAVSVLAAAQQKTGVLKGRIEDAKGKPIAGAEVRVMSSRDRATKETTTDATGLYAFELDPEDYTVSFDAEGFQGGTLIRMHQVEAGKETVVKTIKLEKAQRTSLIRGAVFDISGLPLGGGKVKLERIKTPEEEKEGRKIDSLKRDYVTNRRGEFAFRLPSVRARYRLTATFAGYRPESKIVDVNEGEAVPAAFSLEPIRREK